MNIIHLASFSANIGDVANHSGLYKQLSKITEVEYNITQIEIRDYYKSIGISTFDEKFVEFVNSFDLFILGGGNFFELWWEYSATGTTFDINLELLKKITVPIFINGIGVDDIKGASDSNVDKFKNFLDILFNKNNVFFTVRNEGSKEIFNKYFFEYSKKIIEIPDHGFFINEVEEIKNYNIDSKVKNIGFNLAMDMPEIRFNKIGYNKFLDLIAEGINNLLNKTNYNVFLFPHIQSDFKIILDLLEKIDIKHVRKRISITSLIQNDELATYKHYKECEFIFSSRFHSNICAISLNIPTFGMISYPKHGIVYEKIGLADRKESVNSSKFEYKFKEEIERIVNNDTLIPLKERYLKAKKQIERDKEKVYQELKLWLETSNLNKKEN